ncbi:hypothetical protein ACLF3G_28985 [Falsiroseomonas sp. HC035]|uniref:hypothetical protein n=1 Tax=Falsiroseomonas sp. HC035 TaxID=3390999 RepID=UPI003D31379B
MPGTPRRAGAPATGAANPQGVSRSQPFGSRPHAHALKGVPDGNLAKLFGEVRARRLKVAVRRGEAESGRLARLKASSRSGHARADASR